MEAQVLRRLFETIYVFKYSPSARMHIFGYITTGLFFYTATPLSLCCRYTSEAFAINGSHGSLRSQGKKVDEYVIPYGDWFELVSSPHYLAELYDYAGFVVASGGTDLTIWLLLAFVVLNSLFVVVVSC
ncbi:Polyprenol reductase 2 [Linum perenne]